MKPYNLDHVAIVVRDLDTALGEYERLYGVRPLYREVVQEQGVEEAMIAMGGSFVQLLQPLSPETPVATFLEKNGEGLHHLAFAVADIAIALADLVSEGARLIDESPRIGGRGAKIAFVHPKQTTGTLIELVEHADGP
jgi:methylmalonyl-CoA/ethylmalonyl-CoA epimerase